MRGASLAYHSFQICRWRHFTADSRVISDIFSDLPFSILSLTSHSSLFSGRRLVWAKVMTNFPIVSDYRVSFVFPTEASYNSILNSIFI